MSDYLQIGLFDNQKPKNDVKLTIDELRKEAEACRNCELGYNRLQAVVGEGKLPSDLMLIGEGPGEQEDREGRPFVGRAGELLTQSLKKIGIERSSIWISNVVKCRAYDLVGSKKVNRPPKPEEIRACSYILQKEIELVAPKIIVAIGSPSASSLLGKSFSTITKDRGKWFPYKNIKLIPTFHPAYLLRQMGKGFNQSYEQFLRDLEEAKNALSSKKDEVIWDLPLFKKP